MAKKTSVSLGDPVLEELRALDFPATYLFHVRLPETVKLQIGVRMERLFCAGHYYYVGSAHRTAGHRLLRHWLGSQVRRWHIDYLRGVTLPQELFVFAAAEIEECAFAKILQASAELEVITGFGSSDCDCQGHLWYAEQSVDFQYWVNFPEAVFTLRNPTFFM